MQKGCAPAIYLCGMWHSVKNKPTQDGIIVVARFEGDKMVELSTNWAKLEGYFGPNSSSYFGTRDITHWMYYSEYREVIEKVMRQEVWDELERRNQQLNEFLSKD